jgi:SAM-dependent methyltransferase
MARLTGKAPNESARIAWLESTLARVKPNTLLLDAGAGEGRNRALCRHLRYIAQDLAKYDGIGNHAGLQTGSWSTVSIDVISDVIALPLRDESVGAVLCSEVLEHIHDPTKAIDEFARVLAPGGTLILTAPFASMVHFAPFHYVTGFSRYWYEHHLPARGFVIDELVANGDWFDLCAQEVNRLSSAAVRYQDTARHLTYLVRAVTAGYMKISRRMPASDLGCFGWHCIARKAAP